MLSPKKLCGFEKNFLEIDSNIDLSIRIKNFFNQDSTDYLWKLVTNRQKMTYALRNTEMVVLRRLSGDLSQLQNTLEYNQQMEVDYSDVYRQHFIFQELVLWLETAFRTAGADNIEWGRIFFSKHHANSSIDPHTDEGKYFSYYDRFHFVIDQTDGKNIFHIRDEDIRLEQGKLYWVNNHVPHWLKNTSESHRINLIADARLS